MHMHSMKPLDPMVHFSQIGHYMHSPLQRFSQTTGSQPPAAISSD